VSAISSLRRCIDSVLVVRERIGADHQPVVLITRTWDGRERGDGDYTDVETPITPTPRVKSLAHNVRLTEGGAIKQTDLFIESISMNGFPLESDVDCSTADQKVEKFYKIGDYHYRVISVVQRHVVWDVQVRRMEVQPDNSED